MPLRRKLRFMLPALIALPALVWAVASSHADSAQAVLNPAGTSASTPATTSNTLLGQDISWPQCSTSTTTGLPMPVTGRKFVLVGVNNGRAFTTNPCVAKEFAWVTNHHVLGAAYAIVNHPTSAQLTAYAASGPYAGGTLDKKLRNVGWAEASNAIAVLHANKFTSPTVWLDVEKSTRQPWSASTQQNGWVLSGFISSLRYRGYKVGVYTTTTSWTAIAGTTRFNLPEWRTVGMKTEAVQLAACTGSASIEGGPAAIIQRGTSTVDFNRTCPAVTTSALLPVYFHQY